MMATAIILNPEVGGTKLTCRYCGESGVVLRESGDVMERTRAFAASHQAPRLLAVRIIAGGIDFGWCDA